MKHLELNKNSVSSIADFVVRIYHAPLRHNLSWLESEVSQLVAEYSDEFKDLKEFGILFENFRRVILAHMNEEEQTFFPILKVIEECADGIRDASECNIYEFESVIDAIEEDHGHIDTYVTRMNAILKGAGIDEISIYLYEHFCQYFNTLEKETMRHTEIENTLLHPLAREKFQKIQKIQDGLLTQNTI